MKVTVAETTPESITLLEKYGIREQVANNLLHNLNNTEIQRMINNPHTRSLLALAVWSKEVVDKVTIVVDPGAYTYSYIPNTYTMKIPLHMLIQIIQKSDRFLPDGREYNRNDNHSQWLHEQYTMVSVVDEILLRYSIMHEWNHLREFDQSRQRSDLGVALSYINTSHDTIDFSSDKQLPIWKRVHSLYNRIHDCIIDQRTVKICSYHAKVNKYYNPYTEQYRRDDTRGKTFAHFVAVEDWTWLWNYAFTDNQWHYTPWVGTHNLATEDTQPDRTERHNRADAWSQSIYRNNTFPDATAILPDDVEAVIHQRPATAISSLINRMNSHIDELLRDHPEKFTDALLFVASYRSYADSLKTSFQSYHKKRLRITDKMSNILPHNYKSIETIDNLVCALTEMNDDWSPLFDMTFRNMVIYYLIKPLYIGMIHMDIAQSIVHYSGESDASDNQTTEESWKWSKQWSKKDGNDTTSVPDPYNRNPFEDESSSDTIPPDAFQDLMDSTIGDQSTQNLQEIMNEYENNLLGEEWWSWWEKIIDQWELVWEWDWFSETWKHEEEPPFDDLFPSFRKPTTQPQQPQPSTPPPTQKELHESSVITDLTPKQYKDYRDVVQQYPHLKQWFMHMIKELLLTYTDGTNTQSSTTYQSHQLDEQKMIGQMENTGNISHIDYQNRPMLDESGEAYKDFVIIFMVDVSASMNDFKQEYQERGWNNKKWNAQLNALLVSLYEATQTLIDTNTINADMQTMLYTSDVDFSTFASGYDNIRKAEPRHVSALINSKINTTSWGTNDSTARKHGAEALQSTYFPSHPHILSWLKNGKTKALVIQLSDTDVLPDAQQPFIATMKQTGIPKSSFALSRVIFNQYDPSFDRKFWWNQVVHNINDALKPEEFRPLFQS